MTVTREWRTGRSTKGHAARGRIRGRAAAVVVIAGLTVAGLGGSSGAATPAKAGGLSCDQLSATLTETMQSAGSGGSGFFGKPAGRLAGNLDKAARKVADKRLKKALLGLSSFFDDLSDAGNLTEAAQVSVRRAGVYVRSLQTFMQAVRDCGGTVGAGATGES